MVVAAQEKKERGEKEDKWKKLLVVSDSLKKLEGG